MDKVGPVLLAVVVLIASSYSQSSAGKKRSKYSMIRPGPSLYKLPNPWYYVYKGYNMVDSDIENPLQHRSIKVTSVICGFML